MRVCIFFVVASQTSPFNGRMWKMPKGDVKLGPPCLYMKKLLLPPTSFNVLLTSFNVLLFLISVGSVHTGATFPTIPGSTITTISTQPAQIVTGGFPAEDEQHSQPVSPQGLHYLHSAYRVGK